MSWRPIEISIGELPAASDALLPLGRASTASTEHMIAYWQIKKKTLAHWSWHKMPAMSADYIFNCIFINENCYILSKLNWTWFPHVYSEINHQIIVCPHLRVTGPLWLNSMRPSDASVNWSSLLQIMACCLVGAKPLSEPMLKYC